MTGLVFVNVCCNVLFIDDVFSVITRIAKYAREFKFETVTKHNRFFVLSHYKNFFPFQKRRKVGSLKVCDYFHIYSAAALCLNKSLE